MLWTLGGAKDKANVRPLQGVVRRDRTGVSNYSREKVESVLTEAWRKCRQGVCVWWPAIRLGPAEMTHEVGGIFQRRE